MHLTHGVKKIIHSAQKTEFPNEILNFFSTYFMQDGSASTAIIRWKLLKNCYRKRKTYFSTIKK